MGQTNWHNLGKFASGNSTGQEVHWNNLKSFDSAVSSLIEGAKSEPEQIDFAAWEGRIAHTNILSHMKKNYTETMRVLDGALKQRDDSLDRGWEEFERVRSTCSEATEEANRIISDGIKTLWISQHNPPTWKVDVNEWLESDQYWQAFVEKHAMYSQSGNSNDPESPSEIEANKSKWNVNMFKFNERTDTPMLYDYMHHNPSWEYYDINRRQFFEHLEYFLLRTGEDFRNFPDVPSWKWLTHIEDLRFRLFAVEYSRKRFRQLSSVTRFERTDLGAHEGESEEEVNMGLLMQEKSDLETVVSKLLGGFGFLVDPLVPVENAFQLKYLLSKDGWHGGSGKRGKLYSLGEDLPYYYYLPSSYVGHAGANLVGTATEPPCSTDNSQPTSSTSNNTTGADTNSKDNKDNANPGRLNLSPMDGFYSLMDYLSLNGVKVNPSYSTRLQLKCNVIHQRGPNWLKLPFERESDAFLRRLRYDDPLKPMFKEYLQELEERLRGARELPESKWASCLRELEERNAELEKELNK